MSVQDSIGSIPDAAPAPGANPALEIAHRLITTVEALSRDALGLVEGGARTAAAGVVHAEHDAADMAAAFAAKAHDRLDRLEARLVLPGWAIALGAPALLAAGFAAGHFL